LPQKDVDIPLDGLAEILNVLRLGVLDGVLALQ